MLNFKTKNKLKFWLTLNRQKLAFFYTRLQNLQLSWLKLKSHPNIKKRLRLQVKLTSQKYVYLSKAGVFGKMKKGLLVTFHLAMSDWEREREREMRRKRKTHKFRVHFFWLCLSLRNFSKALFLIVQFNCFLNHFNNSAKLKTDIFKS